LPDRSTAFFDVRQADGPADAFYAAQGVGKGADLPEGGLFKDIPAGNDDPDDFLGSENILEPLVLTSFIDILDDHVVD
jgi:hypothetical protein